MNTRNAQGSFIVLIWTLIVKVKELTNTPIVLFPTRAGMAADFLLLPVVSRSTQRRLTEDASLNERVYRFSSVSNATPACWRGNSSKLCSQ